MGGAKMNAITVRHVFKRYGEAEVLHDFSCAFERGAVTCIMGPSGCGKTTLMRLILGLEKPDAGEIQLDPDTTLSCVFQEDRLIGHYSALKNLRLVTKHKDEAAARALLTLLGLNGSMHKPARTLSGGMARRVAIARALIGEANTILMDEPLKGLDEKTRLRVMEVIRRRTQGKTLVLITHDVTEAEYFGGKTVKLALT